MSDLELEPADLERPNGARRIVARKPPPRRQVVAAPPPPPEPVAVAAPTPHAVAAPLAAPDGDEPLRDYLGRSLEVIGTEVATDDEVAASVAGLAKLPTTDTQREAFVPERLSDGALRAVSVAAVQDAITDGDIVVGSGDGAVQADYVDTLRRLSNYTTMAVKKVNSSGALQVICRTPGGKTLTYEIGDPTRYQYVGRVLGSGAANPAYQQSATRAYPGDITTTGTIVGAGNNGTTHYTTTVGATWAATVTTTTANAKIDVNTFVDDRGGIWNLTLVENTGITGSYSTWAAAAGGAVRTGVLTIPAAGTWTVRATFAGADPSHAPTGGTARGWLIRPDSGEAPTFVRVNEAGLPTSVILSPDSNKDFAFSIRPASGGTTAFVPYHGIDTEDFAAATTYLVDGAPLNVAGMAAGASVAASSFEVVQHIYGLNPASGATNLIEVWTRQRFTPDGVYSVNGRWKALASIVTDFAVYAMMLPATMPLFDQVVSSVGETRAVAPGMAPTNVWLPGDSDHTDSYAALSSSSDFAAAVRYNNRRETLRVGATDKAAPGSRTFIELRTGGAMLKVYNSLYAAGATVPAGTVQRFSGDYWYGEIPAVRDVLSLSP